MNSYPWKVRAANIEFLRSKKVKNYIEEEMNGDSSLNVNYDLNGRITKILYPPYNLRYANDCATFGVKKLAEGKYILSLHLGEDVDNDVKRTLEDTVKEFNHRR